MGVCPVNNKGKKGMTEMKGFEENLRQCLKSFGNERRIFVVGVKN